ncbi:hypothetical protein TrLO_g5768 [Triparma laevis f. longispina]|uniref:Tetratricopeptide repeat protein 8 n=1 Tax=Triparma laevis f. longispina TaxID=1714387 RepID=A0A9W7FH80_9STRA|nr:hypothetical protein TrLO_g5768 [Triparma laevis f. longispina]
MPSQIDPTWLALSRLRRRRFTECIDGCTSILQTSPYDKAVWSLKTLALSAEAYTDETEMEEEGVGELLLDDNAVASMPRPGTSLSAPRINTSDQGIRPMSSSGRPNTGFSRPGSSSTRPISGMTVDAAFRGSKPGTSRPMTTLGREVRLGTASMNSGSGKFIEIDKLNLRKYASRPALAIALIDYLLFVEVNPRKGLELCSEATQRANYKSWFWKRKLGQCYYKLGLYRDAEKQLRSSLKETPMIMTYFDLVKVYLKLDIPNTALSLLLSAGEQFPMEPRILLGIARIYDMLGDVENSSAAYKKVLQIDASSIEAISCLASNSFYTDNPEISLRYYRRLLQMGLSSTELWSNLGLSCFHSSQFDMALSCFSRALQLSNETNEGDVWYNIGLTGVSIGDLALAYQAFKVAVSIDKNCAEAYANLGVLDLRKNDWESAQAMFEQAKSLAPFLFEPLYNLALLQWKRGNLEGAYENVKQSLIIYPDHEESLALEKELMGSLMGLR